MMASVGFLTYLKGSGDREGETVNEPRGYSRVAPSLVFAALPAT
jgi:hypothetical protein